MHRRLAAAGFDPGRTDGAGYGPATTIAVRAFQAARGLPPHGRCDEATWHALHEAGYRLGDRLLYQRRPFLRGDDVAELQSRLDALGFDAGRVDGIFGPDTARAVEEFQRNAGLVVDGVCGPATVEALVRLGSRWTGTSPGVASVREREALLAASRAPVATRVVLGSAPELTPLARAVAHALHAAGSPAIVVQETTPARQAGAANAFDAQLFVGLTTEPGPGSVAFYATATFTSTGGRRLADLVHRGLREHVAVGSGPIGQRLPVLRETRMPAVLVTFGDWPWDRSTQSVVARQLTVAIRRWSALPVL